ncbi:Vacuolar inheritance and morphology protein [Coemansia biformis]|uniref:Vacuolar inheritance and morphology protein n=1 Tax=Coemansia biformis TaxID=1286918 RepID=A0A9W7Y8J2_9FUNG|nr:Vacuolar inheritance and morphology protein [Coemansia biformis]
MGDDEQQQHRTMIKQLTDLDDHALDEQAGLFMHPRRKSLRTETTPRPLSQPFFQPLQVFPDVLSVSAMVERQEQKDYKGQQQQQQQQREHAEPSANQPVPATAPGDKTPAAPASSSGVGGGGVYAMSSSGIVPPTTAFAQYPQGLAVHMPQSGGAGDGAAGGDARGRPSLRSVSLTRIAAERAEAAAGRPASGSDALRRDGAASADPYRAKRSGAPPVVDSPLALRTVTPLDTPAEEGDRQLGAETSRASRVGKRTGKRVAGTGGGSDGRGPQALSGRLFARRANASSRGSEEDNSDGDEQFIYRHSRSSLQVSSIPEENYDERSEQAAKRRANRHRLSTYLGEQRDSAGRVGASTTSAGSYTHSAGVPAHASGGGGGAAAGGGRPGRRPARATRTGGGGGSVATNPAAASGYAHQASINNGAPAHPHRFSILTQANNDFGMSSEESDIEAEPAGLRSTYNSNMYSRRNSRRQQANIYYGSSEDMPETAPLFRRRIARRKRKGILAQALRAVVVAALALGSLLVLVALFNLTSAPLADVDAIRITNILATEKELLFILHVEATNPNIREVLVERAEIGVFAAAAVSNGTAGSGGIGAIANETQQAILLGNVYELSDPMRFAPGSLRVSATGVKTTQISIHHPGGTTDGAGGSDSSRWRQLLQGPYDLTVRGTLQYTLWQRNYAARICIAKLANLPPEGNATTGAQTYFAPAALGCDEGDDGDVIVLPSPPTPPLAALSWLLRL